jgi:cobalt-precorrin-5B (C1)-methyltransferase
MAPPPRPVAGGALRRGWTTGACAAAAASGAYRALVTGRFPDAVTIRLPRGERPTFALVGTAMDGGTATAGVVKDAGDDPDVTHGATVLATLTRLGRDAGPGPLFLAGEGVGTVTRAGLPVAVGEPAINPGPRAMIADAIADQAESLGVTLPVAVSLAIPGGADLAAKTLNPRLGIVGGLSILGTTGVVVPYSCAAWVHAIHRGVDVARAAGCEHLIGATGSVSEAAARARWPVPDQALIDMGDFVGGLLKYLRRRPVARLTLAGGFAKLAKLAQGHMDLHSARSQVDLADLRRRAADLDADPAAMAASTSAGELLAALPAPVADRLALAIAQDARAYAVAHTAAGVAIAVAVFDRQGRLMAHADG